MPAFAFNCVIDRRQWSKTAYMYSLTVPCLGWTTGEQSYLGATDGLERSWRMGQNGQLHLTAVCEPHVKSTAQATLPLDAVVEDLCVRPSTGFWVVTCPAKPAQEFCKLRSSLIKFVEADDLPAVADVCESIWRLDNPTPLDLPPLPPELCSRVQRMARVRGWDKGALRTALYHAKSKEAVTQLAREDALAKDDVVTCIEYGMNKTSFHPGYVEVQGVWVFSPFLEVFGIDPAVLNIIFNQWVP